jgi:hypothetical protein
MLTAVFAFVLALAKGAPAGVMIAVGVYLLAVTITLLPRWAARWSGGPR